MPPDEALEKRLRTIEEKLAGFAKAINAIEVFSNQQRQVLLKALGEEDRLAGLVERFNSLESRFVKLEQEGLRSTEDYLGLEERLGKRSQDSEAALKAISDELRALRESLEIEVYKTSAKVEKKLTTRLEPLEKSAESVSAVRDRIDLLEKLVNDQLSPLARSVTDLKDLVPETVTQSAGALEQRLDARLGSRLDALEKRTSALSDLVPETVTQSSGALEQRLDARLGSRLEAVEKRTAALSDLFARIDALEGMLNKQIAPLKGDVSAIKERVTLDVEKAIGRVEARVNGKLDPLSSWVGGLGKKVESMDRRVQALPDVEARVTKLEGLVESAISPLGEKLSSIETSLSVGVDDAVARLEERVDARMGAAESREAERIQTVESVVDDRLAAVDAKLAELEETARAATVLSARVSKLEDQLSAAAKTLSERLNAAEVRARSDNVELLNRVEALRADTVEPLAKDHQRLKEFAARAATSAEVAALRTDSADHGAQIKDLIAITSKLLDQLKAFNTVPPRLTKAELRLDNLEPLRSDFQNIVTMTRKVGRLTAGVESRLAKNERELGRLVRIEEALTALSQALGELNRLANRNELDLANLKSREVVKSLDEHEKRIDDLFRLQQKVLYASEEMAKKLGSFEGTLGTGADTIGELAQKVDRRIEVFEKELQHVRTENESLRLAMGDAVSAAADLEEVKKDIIRLRVREKKIIETLKSMKDKVSMVIT